MANYYVRSAAAGSGDGSTWANAYTTLAAAFNARSAGDTFWVADDHAETQASAMTLTSPGTAASPCRVLCVNTHATEPPTALATSATITTTGTNAISFNGFAYAYGVTFTGANGSSSIGAIAFGAAGNPWGWVLDSCKLATPNTSTSTKFLLGTTSSSSDDEYLQLINTTMKFGATGQSVTLAGARFIWRSTSSAIDAGGSTPTTLFVAGADAQNSATISGVDLSALGSGKSLVNVGTASSAGTVFLRNCKLGASVAAITGTIVGPGGAEVYLDNCESGSGNYRMEHYKYQGSIKHETTKIRTAGAATDGATPISHNLTTLSSGPSLFSPLEGPWLKTWNETTGSSITVTVEVCTENVALYDDECWLEVEYLGTSGYPQSVYATSRVASAFATHAALATSGAPSWSGFTTALAQRLSLSFTPQVKGQIRARVCFAKANATVYVDPQIAVGSGPTIGRSYLDAGSGGYVNETSGGGARSPFASPVIRAA